MVSALHRVEKAPGSVRANTYSLVGHGKQISAAHPHPHPTSPVCSVLLPVPPPVLEDPFEAFHLYSKRRRAFFTECEMRLSNSLRWFDGC